MSLLLALVGGGGGPSTITGTLAATEASDGAAFVGLIDHTGAIAATEAADTAAAAGLIDHVGSLAVSELSDTVGFSGAIGHSGVLSGSENSDSVRISGSVSKATVGRVRHQRKILVTVNGARFLVPEDIVDSWIAQHQIDVKEDAIPTKNRNRKVVVVNTTDKAVKALIAGINNKLAANHDQDDEELLMML